MRSMLESSLVCMVNLAFKKVYILQGMSIEFDSIALIFSKNSNFLRFKGKTLLGVENKKFVDITQQCFALSPQVSFPANNLTFH